MNCRLGFPVLNRPESLAFPATEGADYDQIKNLLDSPMVSRILHIDMDAFYASVDRNFG